MDLHHHIIQEFAFIKLQAFFSYRGDAGSAVQRNLDEIISLLEGAIQHTRLLTFEISIPFSRVGFGRLFEWLASSMKTGTDQNPDEAA